MKEFILIAGPCAIEDKEMALHIAKEVKSICTDLGIRYIFKGSYRKANRSRLDSFTGIGDEKALRILKEVGEELGLETITDIHESHEAEMVAKFVDHIQIPAFLCRQTDLLVAAAKTGKVVNIKKGQFAAAEAMKFAATKVEETGNNKVLLTERGNSYGKYYDKKYVTKNQKNTRSCICGIHDERQSLHSINSHYWWR